MRVFVSHSSKDKPAVEKLAVALRERGIDAWVDKWEIRPGDDIVARINEGLEAANAGLVVFSASSRESGWVEAEVSYLAYARIVEGKALIPVVAGEEAWVPPLLRPLARRGIEEVDAIVDALLNGRAAPRPSAPPSRGAWNACASACAGRARRARGSPCTSARTSTGACSTPRSPVGWSWPATRSCAGSARG